MKALGKVVEILDNVLQNSDNKAFGMLKMSCM